LSLLKTYWLLQKGSYIVAEQGLTASTQGLAAVHLSDLQRAIVLLLYNYGDTYDNSIRTLLQKKLGFFATDEQVSQAVESLLNHGILAVKTSFAVFLFVASFVRRKVGCQPTDMKLLESPFEVSVSRLLHCVESEAGRLLIIIDKLLFSFVSIILYLLS